MRILFKQLNEKRKGNDYEEGSEEEEVSDYDEYINSSKSKKILIFFNNNYTLYHIVFVFLFSGLKDTFHFL